MVVVERETSAPAIRPRGVLALALVLTLHVALLLYAFPFEHLGDGSVLGPPDYLTHFHQTSTLAAAVAEHGRFWIYDPNLLAGYPTGLVFDVDNKAHFLFAYGLHRLGLPLAMAFNLFAVVAVALAPFMIWIAARTLGFDRRAAFCSFTLATLVWHLDSTARFLWSGGMISFAVCAALSALTIATFHRALTRGGWAPWLASAALLPICLLIHVWAFAILVVPMLALYLQHGRGRAVGVHARIWGLAALAVLVNAYWLLPALGHLHEITPSTAYGQATPGFLLADFIEYPVDPHHTGRVAQRTLFRFAALLLALVWISGARRARDPRAALAGLSLAWLFGLAYAGALAPGVNATEPYRFVVPGALMACVFAGPVVARACTRAALRGLTRRGRALALLSAVLLLPRVTRQLLYFVPELVPRLGLHQYAPEIDEEILISPPTYRILPAPASYDEVARYVDALAGDERVLVEWWPLAEYLAAKTDKPIIGGFPDRRLPHESANMMRTPHDWRRYSPEALAEYVARYNVRYVIDVLPLDPAFERNRELFQPKQLVAQRFFVHEVRRPQSYFEAGAGAVARAELGLIEVVDATPEPGTQGLTLRYHYQRELRCEPRCRLSRSPVPGDDAGFIRVEGEGALPRRFVIRHGD